MDNLFDAVASISDNGHTYYLCENSSDDSWKNIKTYCETVGAHLATITSHEENEVVHQLLENSGFRSAFIGGTDAESEGIWKWITGEEWSYENWGGNEPDNSNIYEGGQNYLRMMADGTWDDTWNGGEFMESLEAFIYEIDNVPIYKIVYYLDGGINDRDNPNTYSAEISSLSLKAPSKKYYEFVGWYTEKTGGEEFTLSTKLSGDLELYARWTPIIYTITFDVNGGEPLANSTLNLTHESVNVSLPIPTRNGYVFEGWFDAREGGSKVTSVDQPTSDRVLYAQWTVQSGTEPHVHNYERTIAKDATCMEAGMAAYICSGCNDQYTEEIPALGHEWDNGQVTRKASCTEVGIMTYTCRRCGEIHTEELPASDHGGATVLKFEKKATCTVDGYSGDTYCVECGKLLEIGTVVPSAGHQWNEGVVVQEATNTSDGLKIYTCNVCGTSKKEIIKAAGENSKPDPATPQPGIPEKPTVTVGMTVQDIGSGGVYKVTGSGTAVEFVKPINAKKKAVTVPNTIVVNGVTCKVTSIAAKAFKGNKTLTKVTIPSNIKSIGKQAFSGCKKLKSITIKTKLLTSKTVGSKAFKGIYAKATVKVPRNKRKAYKTLLRSKGVGKKAKFK